MNGFGKSIVGLFVTFAIALCPCGLTAYAISDFSTSNSMIPVESTQAFSTNQYSWQKFYHPKKSTVPSTYKDSRWPTNNPDLLAIPESDRWYNAISKIGEYGTIAGPVKSVYQAKSSAGMPVFINIGADYPSPERAQVVLWAEDVPDCEEMLHAIDHGNAWISFTGQISLYNGVPEINFSDGPVSWTYWTF